MPPFASTTTVPLDEARRRVADLGFWYHTLDIAPGLTTPGWFDLRHAFDVMPFPDVAGKRCLDVGTFDGFYAFEMERRGAAEVVAIDIEDHEHWDWPADARAELGASRLPAMTGPPKGAGFRLVHELIDSKVDWRACNIYDVSPELLGEFDVVVVGSMLIHLQNPVKALEAVRTVCAGEFFSCDQIDPWLSILGRGKPLARLLGTGSECQWWQYNAAGHARILYSAGFEILERSPFLMLRYGQEHPKPPWLSRGLPTLAAMGALTKDRNRGVLHRAIRAKPRL